MNPLVSIITVNYKQPKVTYELLASISKLQYPFLEVIVVDNDQQQDDSDLYKSILPSVKVINVAKNAGFAGGNNIGIEAASGEYIFLANNDTEIANGVIESLISRLDDHKVAAVSPIIKYFSEPNRIQFAGFTPINSITGRNELLREPLSETPYITPYFHGAAVMIKRSAIEECGLMPEEYFLYYEELEWSRIMTSAGYQLLVDPQVHILHKESVSTGKNSPLKVYYQLRNRIHFMRNSARQQWTYFLMYFLFIAFPKNLLHHTIRREWKHLKALFQGSKDALISRKYGFVPLR